MIVESDTCSCGLHRLQVRDGFARFQERGAYKWVCVQRLPDKCMADILLAIIEESGPGGFLPSLIREIGLPFFG